MNSVVIITTDFLRSFDRDEIVKKVKKLKKQEENSLFEILKVFVLIFNILYLTILFIFTYFIKINIFEHKQVSNEQISK